jgi:hypothetical protein
MRDLIWGMLELISGMRESIQATIAHVDAIAARSLFALVHFLEQPRRSASFSRTKWTGHLLTLEHRCASGVSSTSSKAATSNGRFASEPETAAPHRAPRFESPRNGRPSMVR